VTPRGCPTERIRAEIDHLFASEGDLEEVLEKVGALEAEVTEFLGRDRYQRRQGVIEAKDSSPNGYGELTMRTTSGPVTLARPKLGHHRGFRLPPPRGWGDQDERD